MNYPETIKKQTIKQWAEDDRPREKMLLKGRAALSDAELLAILISSGNKEHSALELGKIIMDNAGNNLVELGRMSINDFIKIRGIGEARAIAISAALELGRRRKETEAKEKLTLSSSKDAYLYFEPLLSDLNREEFWILLLNRNNRVITRKRISEGGVSGTVVDLKFIFKSAIEELASSIVLCHNHPSGSTKPSDPDIQITKKIKEAAKLLDMSILDHIIIGEKSYFSFADEGMI